MCAICASIFFRGVALYIILVDHVAGDSIARFTYHKFGFSDGARRASLIYAYYILSGIAIILLLTAASGSIKNAGSFILLREEPISAIWSTIFLISRPELPGILVLYLLLTLIAIPLFLMGAARSGTLTLAVSGFIWAISQFYPGLAPICSIIRILTHSPGSFCLQLGCS